MIEESLRLWRAETRSDKSRMAEVFAENFFEFGRSGRRYGPTSEAALIVLVGLPDGFRSQECFVLFQKVVDETKSARRGADLTVGSDLKLRRACDRLDAPAPDLLEHGLNPSHQRWAYETLPACSPSGRCAG